MKVYVLLAQQGVNDDLECVESLVYQTLEQAKAAAQRNEDYSSDAGDRCPIDWMDDSMGGAYAKYYDEPTNESENIVWLEIRCREVETARLKGKRFSL